MKNYMPVVCTVFMLLTTFNGIAADKKKNVLFDFREIPSGALIEIKTAKGKNLTANPGYQRLFELERDTSIFGKDPKYITDIWVTPQSKNTLKASLLKGQIESVNGIIEALDKPLFIVKISGTGLSVALPSSASTPAPSQANPSESPKSTSTPASAPTSAKPAVPIAPGPKPSQAPVQPYSKDASKTVKFKNMLGEPINIEITDAGGAKDSYRSDYPISINGEVTRTFKNDPKKTVAYIQDITIYAKSFEDRKISELGTDGEAIKKINNIIAKATTIPTFIIKKGKGLKLTIGLEGAAEGTVAPETARLSVTIRFDFDEGNQVTSATMIKGNNKEQLLGGAGGYLTSEPAEIITFSKSSQGIPEYIKNIKISLKNKSSGAITSLEAAKTPGFIEKFNAFIDTDLTADVWLGMDNGKLTFQTTKPAPRVSAAPTQTPTNKQSSKKVSFVNMFGEPISIFLTYPNGTSEKTTSGYSLKNEGTKEYTLQKDPATNTYIKDIKIAAQYLNKKTPISLNELYEQDVIQELNSEIDAAEDDPSIELEKDNIAI